ncbi:MAG: citramalate synthase [Deltaproteobacteria bacterium]|nr:citramalate synthase [Deltaproteobacteria bacterium]
MDIKLYDTTLRDGTQAEEISFTVEDKIRISKELDDLGIHYIEGGWPGSNPRDIQFFKEIKNYSLSQAKIVAFSSTARPKTPPEKDTSIKELLKAKTEAVTIVGKSWDIHVREALGVSLKENLKMISETIAFLKQKAPEVIFDAEHFFDGYRNNPEYARQVIKTVSALSCDCIVLCDTNGGGMPFEIQEIIRAIKPDISVPLGIHCHNDSEMAVANSIMAVKEGVAQVQGTMNGFGERCGNANLCSIIPNLHLKLGIRCVSDGQLRNLVRVSRFVYELANLSPLKHQPFVGDSAFAHKGGIHVHAVQKNPQTYEHIRPELVGNRQRVLISDLSGKSNIIYKANELGIKVNSRDPVVISTLEKIKEMENRGYQFEGAEASFELLLKSSMGLQRKYFDLVGFRVISEKRRETEAPLAEATIMIRVGGKVEHTAAMGNGPVNALDNAIRKALEKFYPQLKEMELMDYKVRVISTGAGTGAQVRVLIESGDKKDRWGTVGLSENIIEASWQALVDSITYKLLKDEEKAQ